MPITEQLPDLAAPPDANQEYLVDLPTEATPLSDDEPTPATCLTRRRLLRRWAAGGALSAVGTLGYAVGIEPIWPQFVRRTMPIPELGRDLAGFRIIHISDLHVGTNVPMAYLDKWVKWISRRRADLVVVTGDLVHFGQPIYTEPTARLLARIEAGEGVLATMGNHDWATSCPGGGLEPLANRVAASLAQHGVRLLRNQSVTIRRGQAQLCVVGMEEYWGKRFDPDAAFAHVPASVPCIALSHNPDSFMEILDRPACWVLSGHTHGGQVSIPFFGPPFVPIQHKEFAVGHHVIGDHNLYVNRGLGWLRRIRFAARPEITEFTLTHA